MFPDLGISQHGGGECVTSSPLLSKPPGGNGGRLCSSGVYPSLFPCCLARANIKSWWDIMAWPGTETRWWEDWCWGTCTFAAFGNTVELWETDDFTVHGLFLTCTCDISKVRFSTKTAYTAIFPYPQMYEVFIKVLFFISLARVFLESQCCDFTKFQIKPTLNILAAVFWMNPSSAEQTAL